MAIPLLQSSVSMELRNVDEDVHKLRKKAIDIFGPHDLILNNQVRPVNPKITYTQLKNVLFSYFNYHTESTVDIDFLRDYYVVEIPLSGFSETFRGKERVLSRQGRAVIISPGTSFRAHWSDDCSKLLAFVNSKALNHQLSYVLDDSLKQPVQFTLGVDIRNGKGAAIWRTMQFILKELEYQAASDSFNTYVDRQIEQMFISSLLFNNENNYSDRLNNPNDSCEPAFLRKVEDYIDANCAEQLTVEDLAKSAHISPQKLFNGFRKYKATTPINYLNNVRFERVHEALKKAGKEMTVSQIAMEWGFYQLGRFSVEYKKRFGESPSHTLRS